jgi:hypothetical protein
MMKLVKGAADPARRAARVAEPHMKLMVAVLQRVVDDCRFHQQTAGYRAAPEARDVRQAIAYVASTDRRWPFSFENLCEALGVDAGQLRQELWRKPRR